MKIYKRANNCCIRDFTKWITLQNKNPKIPDKVNRTKTAKKQKKEKPEKEQVVGWKKWPHYEYYLIQQENEYHLIWAKDVTNDLKEGAYPEWSGGP